MASTTKYRLKVTAGPSYDPATHTVVAVNSSNSHHISTPHGTIDLRVRIRNYTGLPSNSPQTSPYFEHPNHTSDQYSIAIRFIPTSDISGDQVLFGNDFDRPIRDRLPPGFNQALKFVRWFIDPGLEGDAYADKPWMYGPALSSWNILRIGERVETEPSASNNTSTKDPDQSEKKADSIEKTDEEDIHETVILEGGQGTGETWRSDLKIPDTADARKKHFLDVKNREAFTFEKGREYYADFGNPYLDFNDFSLRLPRFHLNVLKYIDDKTHELRYVLKNKVTGDVYYVLLFTLLFSDAEGGWDDEDIDAEEVNVKGVGKDGEGGVPADKAGDGKVPVKKETEVGGFEDEGVD